MKNSIFLYEYFDWLKSKIDCYIKQENKEEVWLSPMTEALIPTENSKKQSENRKTLQ